MFWLYRKKSGVRLFALCLVFMMVFFSFSAKTFVFADDPDAAPDSKAEEVDPKEKNDGNNTKMILEIDPDNWDPNPGGNSTGDNGDIIEEIETQDPTIPYGPYEDLFENTEIPLEGLEEDTESQDPELVPLSGLEEEVIYLNGEETPAAEEVLAPADHSPLTGGGRNTAVWIVLSILSFLGILFVEVFIKKEY